MQVDYVDFFILGFAARRESVFYEPLLKALEKFKKQGKTRYLGVATHSFEPEAIRAAADTGIYDLVMTAYNFRKNNIAEIDEAIGYATEKGLGIIAMKTMAGVFWDKERTRPINTKASLKWVLKNENIHTTVPERWGVINLNHPPPDDISFAKGLVIKEMSEFSTHFYQQLPGCFS